MKKYLFTLILTFCVFDMYAQGEIEAETEALVALEQYQAVIDKFSNISPDYSYQTLYNIGLSYYMLSDDENCLKVMDLAIAKDSMKAAPHYIKGSTYCYMNQLDNAIPLLQKAINLESDSAKLAKSYRNLGFAYYHQHKTDLSIEAYHKAIENEKENPLPYIMIAQLYNDMGKDDFALEYYYKGKENSSGLYEEYTTILFNIGLAEQQKGNYKKAESSYLSLIEIDPTDYHTYAKLIQAYNQMKEYDKIQPLKAVLYDAHKKDLIKDENLSDMFCIDQFKVDNIAIKAFERYEDGHKDRIYNKILFYILDKDDNIEYRIQTEYSPAAVAFGEAKYILCANKDNMHINYGLGFTDDSTYEDIKNAVIKVLEGELSTAASVRPDINSSEKDNSSEK